jgi:hypothetical protein
MLTLHISRAIEPSSYIKIEGLMMSRKVKFDDGAGYFDDRYFLYVQQLGKASRTGDINVIIDNESTDGITGRLNKIQKLFKRSTPDGKQTKIDIFNRVLAEAPKIWAPHAMHGAEYEGGSFEARVAQSLRSDALMAGTVKVNINLDQLPSLHVMNKIKSYSRFGRSADQSNTDFGKILSLGERLAALGIDAETDESVYADDKRQFSGYGQVRGVPVHFIVPEKTYQAATWLLKWNLSEAFCEPASHRGIDFAEAAVRNALTPQAQAKLGDSFSNAVGWYEVKQGLFWTIDDDMFTKAKTAFGLEKPVIGQAAKPNFG